jgi:hypothetical protein
MKQMHRYVAGLALVIAVALAGRARGQAVEQVPSNATGVFQVKNLQELSNKIAKLAKTLGVDQMEPRFADPLGSLMTEMDVKEGLNKNGDMAMGFLKPAKDAENPNEPDLVVVLPVDDYKAFLGNFQDVKDVGGGISEVTVKKNSEKLVMAHRGKYAVSAKNKKLLETAGGFKLQGSAVKEAQAKDALLYIDVKSIRTDLQEGYKKARGEIKKALEDPNNAAAAGVKVPPFVFAMYDKVATELINGTRTVAISFNLNDVGLGAAVLGDFDADSYVGKLVAKAHNGDRSVLSGLPDRPYLMYGGATLTPEVTEQVFNDFLDIVKQNPGDLKKEDLDKYTETARKALSSVRSMNFGLVAPQQGEPFIQVVELIRGDSQQMLDMSKQAMPFTNNMMAGMNTGKMKANIKFEDPTTVDGVKLTPYKVNVEVDPNDAMAAQQKQIMDMMYGPNGMSGLMGAVNDKTFISLMTPNQKLVSDAIAAAKADKDVLSQSEALKQVAAQLPARRGAEFYIALDNIANTAVAVAKQNGLPVQFKLPPNLPPIGVSMSNEGSTCRVDGFIPTRLVESITAAVLQAMNNQGGNKGV